MKLVDHVDKIKDLIEMAFDKYLARVGIGKSKKLDIERIPSEFKSKRMRLEEMFDNYIGETGSYEYAREKLVDELTFTLFNRLAAVKVMEGAALFPPVLTKKSEHGDRSFGHKAWLELNPHMRSEELEGIREYLKHAFNELGETLPLYNIAYPFALLPDAISLNEIIDTFNAVEKDPQTGNNIWQSDDVLGWMYESYNNVKKKTHKDSGNKTEYHKVSLQSQVYTPRWVVQFLVENSLGKLYLEMYPDSKIKDSYKIANAPKTQERKPKPLHEVKVIDPACGSGNFLLYAFDFFYELYVDQIENYGAEYEEKDIPKLITANNLHGIDLDDRAVQLAQLGLFIKAKKKRRSIDELTFNVISSDFYLPDYEEVEHIFNKGDNLDSNQQELMNEIWSDLQLAYKFGSLIRLDEKLKSRIRDLQNQIDAGEYTLFTSAFIEEEETFAAKFFNNLKTAVEQYVQVKGDTFLTSKTRDAITFLELLTTEYDVATANPPYTDSADYGPELKIFIEENYKKPYKFHTNLYATFIKRCYDLTRSDGKIAMIHPHTFMFIKTFEDVRKFMIDKCHVDIMVDFGLDRVNLFGPGILLDATFYIMTKGKINTEGLYFSLTNNLQEKRKKSKFLEALNDYIADITNDRVYVLDQEKLKIIKAWPFIYWISEEFREKFKEKTVEDYLGVRVGLKTGNNNRFLRFWWEVLPYEKKSNSAKWFSYSKGGPYQKWSGNSWAVVNWENQGEEIIEWCKYLNTINTPGGIAVNRKYYFREGITYSASGSKGVSFRYLPEGSIFDVGGSSIFIEGDYKNIFYFLAFLNSKIIYFIANCLNPTVNIQVGDIKRIPVIIPDQDLENSITMLSKKNVEIQNEILKSNIVEKTFLKSPLESRIKELSLMEKIKEHLNHENYLITQVLINEAIINEKIFEVYDLTEHDKAMVLAKEGESIGGLPLLPDAKKAYLSEIEVTEELPLNFINNFIELTPTREFDIDESEQIKNSFLTLYQSNNNLEEFCIRYQVNPINVWYWFKQSNVIPKQRMYTMAMEFLADIIRDVLMKDEDGIIPLVPNAGEKVLTDRIEERIREKGFNQAQYSGFDSILGRPLNEYLNKFFFAELSDHLNLFMYLPKTPFIWHLSSGLEKGFDCYIIIYKWSRDKLMRIRSVYIEHRERALINRQSDLTGIESAEAQNEKDLIFRQLKEIEGFKVKIDELLAEGYNPVLDDGVGKNIAPLQKKGMIPYDVLNEGQLKKYLNADW